MALTYTQKKLVVFFKNRLITDVICWTLLLLIIIGILTVDLWRQSDVVGMNFTDFVNQDKYFGEQNNWLSAFLVVVKESLLYLIGLAIVVYFNLTFIKNKISNHRVPRWQRIGLYLLVTMVMSIIFAVLWVYLSTEFAEIFRTEVKFLNAVIINFCLATLSTGMLNVKELNDARAKLDELEKELKVAKRIAYQEKEHLTFYEYYLKIGKERKWEIIPYNEIYFFRGGGNDPQIFMKNGRIWGDSTLEEYSDLLPRDKFIRVHRSYIIAKKRVRARNGNLLFLVDVNGEFLKHSNGERMGIPISETYLKNVNADAFLNFGYQLA